ncbi:DUF397 domain-containing protein [Haloechinothrix sp. YIM 98757]|uniref:DUF397 domain-containing protein n=1 Tax=Haloechinothrix aidingensis TaxID=2752311 RepID=A0A838ADL8_9PSEU|nr:DUF397 domain-containing protein [Haloechinothrix aidingensis]
MNNHVAADGFGQTTPWQKSSHSKAESDCVEVAAAQGRVGIRDSKLADDSPILRLRADEFQAFLRSAKAGTVDPQA